MMSDKEESRQGFTTFFLYLVVTKPMKKRASNFKTLKIT